eukprot:14747723-Heterocapsa_arctica.AAC.1
MPTWWGLSTDGETAKYDESTLLFTARQLFEHEYDETLDPSITIPPASPSTPPRSTQSDSGEGIAVPASPVQTHSATRRASGDHRRIAKKAKRAARKTAKDPSGDTPSPRDDPPSSSPDTDAVAGASELEREYETSQE